MSQRLSVGPILSVRDLTKHYPARGAQRQQGSVVHAVDGVSFDITSDETLGLVGETGCGKSTVARLVTRLLEPTSGTISYAGRDITHWSSRRLKPIRREIQIVFQDPYASLNPRRRVGSIVGDPLRDSRHRLEVRSGGRASPRSCASSGSTLLTPIGTRTSSRAVSASASASPVRSSRIRSSSSPTSRYRRSTCRSRRKFSTSWPTCGVSSVSRSSSSRTMSRSSGTSATGSR